MADKQQEDGNTPAGTFTSRRGLLRGALAGAALLVVGGAAAVGGPLWSRMRGGGKRITLQLTALPQAGADPLVNRDGKFWLINNADGAMALSWVCPHAGCIVPWNESEGRFHCPCHNSTFDRQGVCTGGPAPRALDLYALSVAAGAVTIDTGMLTQRQGYDPSQATRLPG
jgi:cytochrome b6-f complex iron-sulfur subunit